MSTKTADIHIYIYIQTLNERKKFYSNFVKNHNKARLYREWMESSPEFLPLKYKPKRIPGEIPSHTKAKVSEAKHRYKNDVNLMMEYSRIHQARVVAADKKMHQLIIDSCKNEEELAAALAQIWADETSEQEMRAVQGWTKIERFLNKKKHDDSLRNQETLTDTSWDETLSRRVKARRQTQQTTTQFYYYPSPW